MCDYDVVVFLLLILITFTKSQSGELKISFASEDTEDKRYNGEPIPFSLEEVINKNFSAKGFNGTWISPKKILYWDAAQNSLLTFDAETLESKVFLKDPVLNDASSVWLSSDESCLLIGKTISKRWRWSSLKKYGIYDLKNKSWSDIADGESVSLAIWSSVGNDLVYVLNNDIYYRQNLNDSVKITRLTFTGLRDEIFNGISDWVYEEEVFESATALEVSPDGRHLLFVTINDTAVREIYYSVYGEPGELDDQYPSLKKIKYPKAGSNMPKVTLNVISLANLELSLTTLQAPADVGRDHILFTFTWLTNDTIAATWTNRVQNTAQIISYDLNGKSSSILTLNEAKGWVTPSQLIYHDGYLIFLQNQDSGTPAGKFTHITKVNISDKNNSTQVDLTPGVSDVISIVAIDENSKKIYYLATAPYKPSERNLYSVSIDKKENPTCNSCSFKSIEGRECKFANAQFSLDTSFYALTCTGPDPVTTAIYNSTGDPIFTWQNNKVLREKLTHRLQPIIKEILVLVNGYQCPVKLFLPPGFSQEKKYPLLVYVYAGPKSVAVLDKYSYGFEMYMATNRTSIYALMDGRGSGNKGSKMLFEIYRVLGTVEIQDIIAITQNLQKMYSWIDEKRTAIWGHSYGGYATGMVLATDKDFIFKCGISVAPVTSYIYYDAVYTERYMGLPTVEDNLSGFNKTDLTRIVEGIRGKDFLLIHGTGDDNVHYQNSMALAKALARKGIFYESMTYPDEAHSLTGVAFHRYYTMDRFLGRCLNLSLSR